MPDIETVNPKNKTWTVRELISRLETMPQDADAIAFLSPRDPDGDDALPINRVLINKSFWRSICPIARRSL